MNFRSTKKRYEKEREAALKRAMDQMDLDMDQVGDMFDEDEIDTAEDTGITEIAREVASFIAARATEHFVSMTEGANFNSIMAMLCIIEYSDPRIAVTLLKAMFYAGGMEDAALELDIIVNCSCYCEDICEMFIDIFLGSDAIDDFFIERILEVS